MNSDAFSVRAVVVILGAVVLLVAGGEVFLTAAHTAVPDSLDRLGFAALGAIATLLASTRSGVAPVEVVNDPAQPVPVDPDPDERPLHAD